ncbi:MAG: hypothetical protein JSW55_02885 [Chloroflexota bacterium]|nr:MAG: hypothetical protein JSW55_02885 [Chloroflexota bacterium]
MTFSNIIDQVAAKREDGIDLRQVLAIVVVLAAVVLAGLTIYWAAQPSEPVADELTAGEMLSANPELFLARRYAEAAAGKAEQEFLAMNPEVALARRYAAEANELADVKHLAANPELMLARRYAAEMSQMSDADFLAANPEIILYRRYAAGR